jgi:hypothetical protein
MAITFDSVTDELMLKWTTKFNDMVELAAQQTECLTEGMAIEVSDTGVEKLTDDFVGQTAMRQVTTRGDEGELDSPELTRRYTAFNDYHNDIPVYELDVLRSLMNPTSSFGQVQAAAGNRLKDKTLITGFTATVITGRNGDGTKSFPAGQYIAHGSAGMTFEKVLQAQEMLKRRGYLNGNERAKFLWNTTAEMDFMQELEVISSDYSSQAVLENGRVTKWGYFDFTRIEDLYDDQGDGTTIERMLPYTVDGVSSGIDERIAFAFVPRAMKRWIPRPLRAYLVKEERKRRVVLQSDMSVGVSRRHEYGIVGVKFRETHIA